MNITIIANGIFPTEPSVLCAIGNADIVVCCDGALEKYLCWCGRQPAVPSCRTAVVGDGDSLDETLLTEARRLLPQLARCRIAEQEDNDLTKSVRYALLQAAESGMGPEEVHVDILGATGLREDHAMANISLLAWYAEQYRGTSFCMRTDHCTMHPVLGSRTFASKAGQQVSIFSLTPEVPVTVSGLRYPIEERCLDWLWQGSLNEAVGDTFAVQGGTLIVMINY